MVLENSSKRAVEPLERFAEIERLVAKVYFRFSHLFLYHSDLRDFWWGMAVDEEQHAAILMACKAIVENFQDETIDPRISGETADQLSERISSYLDKGTPAITIEEALKIALDIETSEIDAIYNKLLSLCGPNVSKTMENVGVPASVQRQKLKSAIARFTNDPRLHAAAERL
jgi:hypothetical protein